MNMERSMFCETNNRFRINNQDHPSNGGGYCTCKWNGETYLAANKDATNYDNLECDGPINVAGTNYKGKGLWDKMELTCEAELTLNENAIWWRPWWPLSLENGQDDTYKKQLFYMDKIYISNFIGSGGIDNSTCKSCHSVMITGLWGNMKYLGFLRSFLNARIKIYPDLKICFLRKGESEISTDVNKIEASFGEIDTDINKSMLIFRMDQYLTAENKYKQMCVQENDALDWNRLGKYVFTNGYENNQFEI